MLPRYLKENSWKPAAITKILPIFSLFVFYFFLCLFWFSDACMNKHHKTTLFWKIKTIQMKVSNISYVAIFTDFGP